MKTLRGDAMSFMPKRVAIWQPDDAALVASTTADLVASSSPPSDVAISRLVSHDLVRHTLGILSPPHSLTKIIGRIPEDWLLGFRVALHFGVEAARHPRFDVEAFLASKTSQARAARAALGRFPWHTASAEEKRLMLTCAVLRAIAARPTP